jgi:surface protein
MDKMFKKASSFNQQIGGWHVKNVTNMGDMFNNATSFNADISDWDTSSVYHMAYMFFGANSFNQPIGSWDLSSINNTAQMFRNASSFDQDLSRWNISSINNMFVMFWGASSLSSANKAKIHTAFVSNPKWPYDWRQYVVIDDTNFQTTINLWFDNQAEANATYGHISDWNTSAVTNMSGAFKERTNFNEDISKWDISNVTNMNGMFWGASFFNQPIGDWDVSSVKDMKAMFLQAGSFNQNIGSWDTGSLVETANMFYAALSFNQNIGNWHTSAITNMGQMFRGATAFNQNLKDWNTSKVSSFFHIFDGAHSFDQDISEWNVSSAYAMTSMFGNSSSLSDQNKGLIHSSFSTNSTWPYDWSAFVEGGGSIGDGGDHNKTGPQEPGGDDQNTTDPYNPGGDHNTTDPGSDTNDTHPFSIPVFELKVSDLAELTGVEGIKAGGSFALSELYYPADPQKTFFQLEEALYDQNIKEWLVAYEGRVFPLLPEFSDYQKLDQFLHVKQLHPVGHIYFDGHNGSDPYDPSKDQNGTDLHEPGGDDKNTTDPYNPGGDHNTTDPGSDTNDTHPFSIPVFELKVSDVADLTGMKGIKTGGSFALTELYEPADPQKTFFQLEEALYDQNIKEWLVAYEGRVFPLLPEFSDYQKLDQFLYDKQLHPVGHIDFDDHNGSDPYDPSKDQNGTDPHEPGWDDQNKTDPHDPGYGDHNSSDKPYEPLVYPPIVQTRRAEILDNGEVRFHGKILFNGGAPVMEAGIFVENEFSGKIERLLLDPKQLNQRDFTITTNQLAPDKKYYYFTFAQNDGGESRGIGLTLRTPASPYEKALIAGAKPVEGGWLESEWFGTFRTFENGWTYHDALGWVFISEEQKDGLWMWRETNGWLWTDSQTWPFLWQHDLANWLYLFPSRPGRDPIFYDYGYSKYRE